MALEKEFMDEKTFENLQKMTKEHKELEDEIELKTLQIKQMKTRRDKLRERITAIITSSVKRCGTNG